MARITKDREERRRELLDISEELFIKYGFENVSVNKIVSTIGIAQGTFYYYFESKIDILIAIFERKIEIFFIEANNICENKEIDEVTKLNIIMKQLFMSSLGNDPLTEAINDDKGDAVHSKIERLVFEKIKSIVLSIVEKGVEKGIMTTEYPDESIDILIMGIQSYIHYHRPNFDDKNYFIIKITAIQKLLEIALGLKSNSLHFI